MSPISQYAIMFIVLVFKRQFKTKYDIVIFFRFQLQGSSEDVKMLFSYKLKDTRNS